MENSLDHPGKILEDLHSSSPDWTADCYALSRSIHIYSMLDYDNVYMIYVCIAKIVYMIYDI